MARRFTYYGSEVSIPDYNRVKYYDLDGLDDHLQETVVQPSGDVHHTFACYQYVPVHTANDVILSQWGTTFTTRRFRFGFVESGGVVRGRMITANGSIVDNTTTNETFTLGNFFHVVITFGASGYVVYINGVKVAWASPLSITSFGSVTATAPIYGGQGGFFIIPFDLMFCAYYNTAHDESTCLSMYNGTTGNPKDPKEFGNLVSLVDANSSTWDGSKYVDANGTWESKNMVNGTLKNW